MLFRSAADCPSLGSKVKCGMAFVARSPMRKSLALRASADGSVSPFRRCVTYWPPVKGAVSASGVKGTFGTIKRSDGSIQATFDGHPLYTYVGDTAPGQAKGNGLNLSGGVWHEITTSGSAATTSSSGGSGGGGY